VVAIAESDDGESGGVGGDCGGDIEFTSTGANRVRGDVAVGVEDGERDGAAADGAEREFSLIGAADEEGGVRSRAIERERRGGRGGLESMADGPRLGRCELDELACAIDGVGGAKGEDAAGDEQELGDADEFAGAVDEGAAAEAGDDLGVGLEQGDVEVADRPLADERAGACIGGEPVIDGAGVAEVGDGLAEFDLGGDGNGGELVRRGGGSSSRARSTCRSKPTTVAVVVAPSDSWMVASVKGQTTRASVRMWR